MGSALWTGISGLNASSKELDVIANNLANTNTVGFKSSTTYFADVLSQSISGGSSGTLQVGRGVSVTEVQTQFSAGSFETTGVATDVAIDGDGFFMVNDADGGTYFTRAGAFRLNSEGLLVDINGYAVQGKEIVDSQPAGVLGNITLADVQSEPQVTKTFTIGANLNSDTATGSQYNASQSVYDSLGAEHSLDTTFTKTGYTGAGDTSSRWAIESTLDSTSPTSIGFDGITFDDHGVCTGMYTGTTTGTVTSSAPLGTVTNPPALSNVDPGCVVVLDRAGMIYQNTTGNMMLTWDHLTDTWSFAAAADKGGYAYASVSVAANGDVNISLDGSGTTDLHFSPTITSTAADATVTFPLAKDVAVVGGTAAAVLNRPGMVYQSGTVTLIRNAADTGWEISSTYPDAIVTSGNTTDTEAVTISLDGKGNTDVTLTPAGTWNAGETATFTLTNTSFSALTNIDIDYSGVTLASGATIGNGGTITWNLVDDNASEITQYSSPSVVRSLTSDGYSSGSLKSISIDSDGIISGFFTNGQSTNLAQIMLAKFTNPWGLQKMGDNLFAETNTSGAAIQNYAGQGGIGSLTSNSLEMSNTDIATEFIKMITAQKAYQANAKVVTTENDMLDVLMNIKR